MLDDTSEYIWRGLLMEVAPGGDAYCLPRDARVTAADMAVRLEGAPAAGRQAIGLGALGAVRARRRRT